MKNYDYAIMRIGSNAANQSMVHEHYIDIIEAPNQSAALELAKQEVAEGHYAVYANQHLRAVPFSRLSKNDRAALYDLLNLRDQTVKAECLVCGKSVGEIPLWQAQNAYCGKCS